MPAYFECTVETFLRTPRSEVLATLGLRYAADFVDMKSDLLQAWSHDLEALQATLEDLQRREPSVSRWHVLLEYVIPRKLSRIDVVLLAGEVILLLECKTNTVTSEALRQVEQYALLLHYFHKLSENRVLWPLVVSRQQVTPSTLDQEKSKFLQQELSSAALASVWIRQVTQSSWAQLVELLLLVPQTGSQLDGAAWN